MTDVRLVLGGPGCGKTTHQLAQVEQALDRGVPPDRIAFVSFTKAAVQEAVARACDKFDLAPKDLPYFRTIHSLCFRALNMRSGDVMQKEDWAAIADGAAVELTAAQAEDELPGDGATEGDRARSLIQYASAVRAPLASVYQEYGEDLDWYMVQRLADTIDAYKMKCQRVDFSDMLSLYCKHGEPIPVDLAVIDEAQDLTRAQWEVAKHGFKRASHIYISGDDDQAIHTWAGAATRTFLSITAPRTILPVSHRLPEAVWKKGNEISNRIVERFPKQWSPATHQGEVRHIAHLEDLSIKGDETWMLLVRNGYMLRDLAKVLRSQGVPYRTKTKSSISPSHVNGILAWERQRKGIKSETAWEYAPLGTSTNIPWFEALRGIPLITREYYRAILSHGYSLRKTPSVLISTIHGVKGMEADNVVLFTDVTQKILRAMDLNADPELRVFYVGATRARKRLYIVEPQDSFLGVTI
jgi:superfamily I DNA/RNA helicase